MFNLIKLIVGGLLFFWGISIGFNVYSVLLTMIGCFIISRTIALDSGFGNTPVLFLIGMLFFIPSYFLTRNILDGMGFDPASNEIVRITLCLVTGVSSFLSICKK